MDMKTIPVPFQSWRLKLTSVCLATLLWAPGWSAHAAVKTWSGAVNGIWSVDANWAGGVAPVNGDDLVFPSGAARTTITNDYATLQRLRVNSISVSGINYVLRGNSLTVSNNLTASHGSPNINTVDFGITCGTNQTFQCLNAGAELVLNGAISLGGARLTASGAGSLTLNGVVSGTGGLTKSGSGTLTLSGVAGNTFEGDTLVNEGLLLLGKSSGRSIPANLVVGVDSAVAPITTARFLNSFQIARSVTVNRSGVLNLNGFEESFSLPPANGDPVLRLNGGGDVQTGAGILRLPPNSTVAVEPGVATGSSTISGQVSLEIGDETFFVNSSISPLAPALNITANIQFNGGMGLAHLTKSGPGEMRLSGNNSFNGDLTLNAGQVTLASPTSIGSASGAVVAVISNATLAIDGSHTLISRLLDLRGSGAPELHVINGHSTWGAVFDVHNDSVVNVNASASFRVNNRVAGFGRLIKTGGGILTLAGGTSNVNTNATLVNEGTLILTNSGVNQTIVGPLIIGDGVGGADADVVRLDRVRQIANDVPVTIHSSGLLYITAGKSDAFGSLAGSGHVAFETSGDLEIFDAADTTFSGVISGGGNFWKRGARTLTLSGDNTHTGLTIVEGGGTLLVNGSQPGSAVIVSNVATLGGSGTVGSITANNAIISPGTSAGILSCGGLAVDSSDIVRIELNGPAAGTGYDQINVVGPVSLGGAALDLSLGFTPEPGQSFIILNNDLTDAVSGTFAGLANGATFSAGGFTFRIRYNAGTGNDIVLNDTRPPAPLVPFGSVWKYLDDGSDQGTAWRASVFNDSAWAAGPAQLGYGDGDEATVVGFGPDVGNKFITTYFRRAFNVSSPTDFDCLLLRLERDDGVVVYLNGVEVVRDNLPAGTITNSTPANVFLAVPYETNVFLAGVDSSLLVAGTNVLAVEIHQSDPFSSDISFDLELTGSLSGGPACVQRRVWNGPAGSQMNNRRWNRSMNWVGNVAPLPGDILHFPAGAIQLTNVNDFPAGTRFHSIEFGGAGYRLQGAEVLLEAGITDTPQVATEGTNVIELPLTLASDQSVAFYFLYGSLQLGEIATAGHMLTWSGVGGTLGSGTIVGGLSGGGGLTHAAGSLRLAGTNTHTGPTIAGGGGSLILDGVVTASTILLTNGNLYGTGAVHAVEALRASVVPGSVAVFGTLTASNVTLGPAASLGVHLSNTNGGHSRLAIFGPVNLGGARLNLAPLPAFTPDVDHVTRIIDNDGTDPVQGTFDGLPEGAIVLIGNRSHFIHYQGGDGNDVELKVVNPVARPIAGTFSSGNGNAFLEPNECSLMNVVLTNSAADTTTGILVTLLSDTPGVTVTQPFSAYPDMPVASRRTNTTPFQVSVAPGFGCGAPIALRVKVQTANHGTYFVPVPVSGVTNASPVSVRFNDSGATNNIIPGGTLRRNISVSGFSGAVGRVEVELHAYGTANENLDIFLVSPDGTRVELSTDNGGASNAYGISCDDGDRTRFSDSASLSITSSTFTSFPRGTYRPEGSLADFNGKGSSAVNGTWTLEIIHDNFSLFDTNGKFRCSSLFLHPVECASGGGVCELCPDGTIAGAVGLSSPTHAGSLVTNGVASACGAPKSCPGTLPSGLFRYEAHAFRGGQADACITATLTSLTGSLDCVIYTNSFNPANLCANYLADAGLRATPSGPGRACSFNIRSNQTFFVIVSLTGSSSGAYTLALSGGDCRPSVDLTANGGNGFLIEWSTGAPGYVLECTNAVPPAPADWPLVANIPTVVNGRYQVTNSLSGSNQFYRLRRPSP